MPTQVRTTRMLGAPAQKAVASRPIEDVYQLVTDAAVYLAASGFLHSANKLLETLWACKLPHPRSVWLADRAFSVLWHYSGTIPSNIPFAVPAIDVIEVEHRRYMTGNRWNENFLTNSAEDPRSLAIKRLAKAMIASYPRKTGPMPATSKDLEAIRDFAAFANTEFCIGHDAYSALTNLVELCSKHGKIEDATRYLFRWQEASIEYWSNFRLECLAACRHAAPLLAQGILAPGYQLDSESSHAYADGLCKTLSERITTGRTLTLGKLSWRQLLEKISKCALSEKQMPFSAQAKRAKWLGSTPASGLAVEEAVKRLGKSLPDDYVEFLLVSDGFEALSPTSVRVFAITEVKWLREAMPDLVAAWGSSGNHEISLLLSESLLIGDLDSEQQLLLVPRHSNGGAGSWECWFFAHWIPGENRYPSFRAYMEEVLVDMQGDAS